ncbi:MAG: hypothetical protein ABSG35_22910, partial [Syntrophobacteraceae bacterium]
MEAKDTERHIFLMFHCSWCSISDWTFRDWRNNNIQPTEKPKKIVLKGVEPNPVLSDTPGWPEL